MPAERTVPSLHIYRRVTNIPSEVINEIQAQTFDAFAAHKRELKFNTDLKANILAPGQLLGFYGALGKIAAQFEIDQLGDYLADQLPGSFDQPATAESFPVHYNTYKGSKKRKSLSIAGANEVVLAEIASMARLAYDFCDAEAVLAFDEAWPPRPHLNQVHILQSSNGSLLQDVSSFLVEQALLPPTIEFDQGSIEDTMFVATFSDKMIAQNNL